MKGSLVIQDQDYGFDALGNLTSREDRKFGVTQSFCYDGLNRLKAARFNGCSSAANDFTYDALGNLTTKEGIAGTMGYGTSGTNVAGPHAITSANGWSYQYDAIGNLTTATKAGESTRTVAYSPFNTPTSITQGSKFSTLVYGPNQDRIKHSDSNGRVTKYVGGIYEEVTKGGITQKIHYVGDFALFIQTGGTTPTNKHEYLHRDHLGSIVAISKSTVASATDINWQSNGAWGERRYQQWNGPLDNSLIPSSTAHGFTDHEHLDSVGLIHMNGRVYDPELGRFMSADPFVQAPYNSQSYNRYSYVFNNPLSYTDPSGYSASCGYSVCSSDDQKIEHTRTEGDREAYEQRRRQAALDQWNYESWSTWYAVNTQNQQWEYMNGTAYNLANFWGYHAFALAAGGDGAKTTNNQTSFDMSTVAFWTGATGFAFEQTRGYVGIHKANYLTDWRVYPNGWTGNKYMSTTALAGLGGKLGLLGFALGTSADVMKIANAKPTERNSLSASAALNFGTGVLAYFHPKRFGLLGLATGVNDVYGKDIGAAMLNVAISNGPNIPHPRPINNDLDRAWEQVCASCKK